MRSRINKIPLPSAEQIREAFNYEPSTGELRWKPRPVRPEMFRTDKTWNTRYAGSIAGTPNGLGYLRIDFKGETYVAHRLIWKLVTGNDPDEIDHINGNRDDNRFENLRLASAGMNNGNQKLRNDNASGLKGANYNKDRALYRAQFKRKSLGKFKTAEEAHAAYCKAASEFFGKFFNKG